MSAKQLLEMIEPKALPAILRTMYPGLVPVLDVVRQWVLSMEEEQHASRQREQILARVLKALIERKPPAASDLLSLSVMATVPPR